MNELDIPIPKLADVLPQKGMVKWIGIRPQRGVPLQAIDSVMVDSENGMGGDHFVSKNKKRQVTLIQDEHLTGVANILGKSFIDPVLTRRNIVVSGINLLALRNRQFRIGNAILEGTGYCHPCSHMEENLGAGGYNAMRGHGGITAKVIEGGEIAKGGQVQLI